VNYEQLIQSLTSPLYTFVPDANFRNGYLPCSQTAGLPCGPNNLADVGIAPGIANYLNTYPSPNAGEILNPITGLPTGTAYSLSELNQPVNEQYGLVKITHTFSPTDSLNLSYLIDNGFLTVYAVPTVEDNDQQRNQYATIEENKIFSSNFLNVAHFSYARSKIQVATIYNPNLSVVPGSGYAATIDVPGLSNLGGQDNADEALDRYTLRDQISWIRGRNSIQAGLQGVYHALDVSIPIINGGVVLYSSLAAFGGPPQYQAFLENAPLVFEGVPITANDSRRDIRHTNFAPYFQDKFQASERLTLNFGLRYDFETNPTETHSKMYNILDPYDPGTGFVHVPHAFATNITKWNFEPRVGFAWDPTGKHKTSIRGGFGIFDDLPLEMQVAISYLFNPSIYNIETIYFPTIPNPFANGMNAGLPTGPQLTAYQSSMNDYIMQYNLFIQQDVGHGIVANVGYVGSKANHLFVGQETNPCATTGTTPGGLYIRGTDPSYATTCTPVNPALGSIVDRYPVGQSNYNSVQFALDRGVGKYAQFRVSYTLSKCLDDGSYYTGNDSVGPNGATAGLQAGSLASGVRNVDYGPCDFDIRNNFTANAVVSLPFQGNRFKSGWQITGIGTVLSGTPFSVFDGYDMANVGAGGAANDAERPNLVPGRSNNPTGRKFNSNGIYWYDPTAFTPGPIGIFGNLGRNTLTAPGFRDIDMGIAKNTKIGESTVLQLRADAFNLLNHTNLGFPDAQLYEGWNLATPGPPPTPAYATPNPTAGQITQGSAGTGGTGYQRQIQLSAKFIF